MTTRHCKVCGKLLPTSGNTDGLCRDHHYEEGNVWVLDFDFDADFYIWRRKFPADTVRNGVNPIKKTVKHK